MPSLASTPPNPSDVSPSWEVNSFGRNRYGIIYVSTAYLGIPSGADRLEKPHEVRSFPAVDNRRSTDGKEARFRSNTAWVLPPCQLKPC
jgi:hypothetical protein